MRDYLGVNVIATTLGMIMPLITTLMAVRGMDVNHNLSECTAITLSIAVCIAWFTAFWVWVALGQPWDICEKEEENWEVVARIDSEDCISQCRAVHKDTYEDACDANEGIHSLFTMCVIMTFILSMVCCGSCNISFGARKRKKRVTNQTTVTYIVQQAPGAAGIPTAQAVAVPVQAGGAPMGTVIAAGDHVVPLPVKGP